MNDRIVELIDRADGRERVLIVQRGYGRYSFRRQWRADDDYKGTGVLVWDDGYPEEPRWWPPGPYTNRLKC